MNSTQVSGILTHDAKNVGTFSSPIYAFVMANTEEEMDQYNNKTGRDVVTWFEVVWPDPRRLFFKELKFLKKDAAIMLEGRIHTVGVKRPGSIALVAVKHRWLKLKVDGDFVDSETIG